MGLKGLKVSRREASEQGNGEVAAENPIRECLLRVYKSRWLLFCAGRNEKSVFSPSVGTRLLLGHLESIYGIAYTASQLSVNLCPQMLFTEKKGIQEQRVFGVMKGEGMDCVLCSAVRQLGAEGGRNRGGEGPNQMKVCWGDQLLGQDGVGTMLAQVPARSSSQARFQEDPISPFCFFTWLCCPAQISDCCCFIQLFRHMHLVSAFAVNDLQ